MKPINCNPKIKEITFIKSKIRHCRPKLETITLDLKADAQNKEKSNHEFKE